MVYPPSGPEHSFLKPPGMRAADGSQSHPSPGTSLNWRKLPLPRLHFSVGQLTPMTALTTLLQLENSEGPFQLLSPCGTSLWGNSIKVQLLPLPNLDSLAPFQVLFLTASPSLYSQYTSCSKSQSLRIYFLGNQPRKIPNTNLHKVSPVVMNSSGTLPSPHQAKLSQISFLIVFLGWWVGLF